MNSSTSTSSSDHLQSVVDDFYFAVLTGLDEEEEEVMLYPISDEKYAEQLWFQEALMSSILNNNAYAYDSDNNPPHGNVPVPVFFAGSSSKMEETVNNNNNNRSIDIDIDASLNRSNKKMKGAVADVNRTGLEEGASEFPQGRSFCMICMEGKPIEEMFIMMNCSHTFCSECIRKHIAVKIQDNITTMVTCPGLNCREMLEPYICRTIVPEEVFDRWENALCESVILGSQKIYCPFKDCSAMLVNDGQEVIKETECPHCRRLFCVECKVPWHSDLECDEYQLVNKMEKGWDDQLLTNLAKKKMWRRCSNCKVYVEKFEGCLHITCRCGYEFCYKCGAKWNQSHGGCM